MAESVSRDWNLHPNGIIFCFPSDNFKCLEANKLISVPQPQPFHDADLIQATREINTILKRVAKANSDTSRKLSFIVVGNQIMLAWTRAALVSSEDAVDKIRLAFCEDPQD